MDVAVTISAWMLGVILIGSPPIRLKSSIGMRTGWLGVGLGLGLGVGLGLGLGLGGRVRRTGALATLTTCAFDRPPLGLGVGVGLGLGLGVG